MTHATKETRRAKARPLALTVAAALLAMSPVRPAHAAAKAPDVDPSRYVLGNIVYPPGVKPAPGTETLQNGEVVKDQPSSSVTIQPKSKTRAKHKSAE
jgi:hypothetical protein